MNIDIQQRDLKYFNAKEISIIIKALEFIGSESTDKKELYKINQEFVRLRQKIFRDKIGLLPELFKEIEDELKDLYRKLK